MSKRNKAQGPATTPAPRGSAADQVAQADAVLQQLREEIREARGALGDLIRERKAVEQLARGRAETVIETHVNALIAELTKHVDRQNIKIVNDQREFFRAFAADLVKKWSGIDLDQLVAAVEILAWLKSEAENAAARDALQDALALEVREAKNGG